MDNWFLFSLIALVAQGTKGFFYKIAAEKKCNTALINFFLSLTVLVLSLVSFFVFDEEIFDYKLLILLACAGGISYSFSTITRMEALKHAATSVVFPITRLSMLIVVFFSVIYFKDELSIKQVFGILLAILVVFIVNKQYNSEKSVSKNFKLGIILAFAAAFFSSIASIVPKFAAISFGTFSFMAFSYVFNMFTTAGLIKKMNNGTVKSNKKTTIILGIITGMLNFVGFTFLLKALAIGPLSLVFVIQTMSLLIPIILSVIIYKERMTLRRTIGIALAILAIILIKS